MKIVAEIGLAHNGDLRDAIAYIDAVAGAGVDAVKFQCHDGDKCNTFRPGTFFPQDVDRQAYYKRTAFIPQQWEMLYTRAKLRGLEFGCSVWSADTVEWLCPFVDFWKVPSGEVGNLRLLQAMAETDKLVVLSSGMSTRRELFEAIHEIRVHTDKYPIILQCTSQYPCRAENIGLELLHQSLAPLSGCGFDGLSDHSGRLAPGICAAWMGADMLEVHVCWDKRQLHPDASASLTIDELALLVRECRFASAMRANPVDKDALAASAEIRAMREIFQCR